MAGYVPNVPIRYSRNFGDEYRKAKESRQQLQLGQQALRRGDIENRGLYAQEAAMRKIGGGSLTNYYANEMRKKEQKEKADFLFKAADRLSENPEDDITLKGIKTRYGIDLKLDREKSKNFEGANVYVDQDTLKELVIGHGKMQELKAETEAAKEIIGAETKGTKEIVTAETGAKKELISTEYDRREAMQKAAHENDLEKARYIKETEAIEQATERAHQKAMLGEQYDNESALLSQRQTYQQEENVIDRNLKLTLQENTQQHQERMLKQTHELNMDEESWKQINRRELQNMQMWHENKKQERMLKFNKEEAALDRAWKSSETELQRTYTMTENEKDRQINVLTISANLLAEQLKINSQRGFALLDAANIIVPVNTKAYMENPRLRLQHVIEQYNKMKSDPNFMPEFNQEITMPESIRKPTLTTKPRAATQPAQTEPTDMEIKNTWKVIPGKKSLRGESYYQNPNNPNDIKALL